MHAEHVWPELESEVAASGEHAAQLLSRAHLKGHYPLQKSMSSS